MKLLHLPFGKCHANLISLTKQAQGKPFDKCGASQGTKRPFLSSARLKDDTHFSGFQVFAMGLKDVLMIKTAANI